MAITAEQKQQLESIGQQYALRLLLLHGSYFIGKRHPESDVDIGYVERGILSPTQKQELAIRITTVFDNHANVESFRDMDSTAQYKISLKHCLCLYGTKLEYAEFRCRAYREYIDSADLRELQAVLEQRQKARLAVEKH